MTTSTSCLGCGATTPSSPCEECLDAQAALESFYRSRGLRSSKTVPMVRADEVVRLTAEVERLTNLLFIYGDHKPGCPQHRSYQYACNCGWKEVRP